MNCNFTICLCHSNFQQKKKWKKYFYVPLRVPFNCSRRRVFSHPIERHHHLTPTNTELDDPLEKFLEWQLFFLFSSEKSDEWGEKLSNWEIFRVRETNEIIFTEEIKITTDCELSEIGINWIYWFRRTARLTLGSERMRLNSVLCSRAHVGKFDFTQHFHGLMDTSWVNMGAFAPIDLREAFFGFLVFFLELHRALSF